eukprot:CFRG0450T1
MTTIEPAVEVDGKTDSEVSNFLSSIPEKPETTIRIFSRKGGEYYSVHGQDALFVAQHYYHTMAVVKYFGSQKQPYVYLSQMMYDSALRDLLLIRQYRVELYLKEGKQPWKLYKKGTPGNLQDFEDDIFVSSDHTNTAVVIGVKMARKDGNRTIGVAYGDATTRRLGLCEFPDNDQFSNLEALIVQLGAKECLLSPEPSNPDYVRMTKMIDRSGMMVTTRKRSEFDVKDIEQSLERLMKGESRSASVDVTENAASLAALNAVIEYLELLSDDSNFNRFALEFYDLAQYMRLDTAAVRALSLFPDPTQANGTKSMSLSGILNKCRTAQGQRLLHQWLKQPLLDVRRIRERQDVIQAFIEDSAVRQSLQEEHLKKVPDLYRIMKKFQRKKAKLADCVRVYETVVRMTAFVDVLQIYEGEQQHVLRENFVEPLQGLQVDFEKFIELIEHTIDMEREDHDVYIKASFDETLQGTRNALDEVEENIQRSLDKCARDLGLEEKHVKLENAKHLGWFYRVTRANESVLRNNKKYSTLETQKSGVRFVSVELRRLNEEHQSLRDDYEERQSHLADEVLNIAGGYTEPIERLNELLATIDAFVSMACVCNDAPVPYVRPTVLEQGSGSIKLTGTRHPCLEMQDDVTFIANDVDLSKGKSSFTIITGPNMGGKSTYIRQIGVIVLMAQIGCFVPCDTAEIAVCDKILARVGAGDSQLRGVSTFMAEMLETASILKSATRDSLVIIDELGRGTSTYDGFGLAWAISEYICKKIDCYSLFATHFHELTALADQVPSVCNLHVTALTSEKMLTLLYKVKPGICDQSFGIHVAELAKFPPTVIEMAKRKASDLEDFKSNDGLSDEETRKRAKIDKEAGDKLVDKFLSDVKALPLLTVSPSEAVAMVRTLKNALKLEGNSYIQKLLESA